MSAQRFRRTKWLIDGEIQLRLALKLAVGLVCYFLLFCLVGLADPILVVLSGDSTEAQIAQAMDEMGRFLNAIYLPLLLAAASMTLHGILLLHRLAGPIYRIRRGLATLADRDLTDHVFLRDKDCLSSMATLYNESVGTLRLDVETAREEVEALVAADLPPGARERVENLRAILGMYRTSSAAPETRESADAADVEEPLARAAEAES